MESLALGLQDRGKERPALLALAVLGVLFIGYGYLLLGVLYILHTSRESFSYILGTNGVLDFCQVKRNIFLCMILGRRYLLISRYFIHCISDFINRVVTILHSPKEVYCIARELGYKTTWSDPWYHCCVQPVNPPWLNPHLKCHM